MGRLLLLIIAGTICWYLIRTALSTRTPSPPPAVPPGEKKDDVPKRPEAENVREARFRDL